MNPDPRNACPPDGHDWTDSVWLPGTQECAWPTCGATREAPAVVVRGVDVPASSMDVGRRAA
jgi:hypothetical protein